MSQPSKRDIARALLDRHGRTFSDELKIHVERNTPAPLFQLLVSSLLFSARISSQIAAAAARALFDQGWTTPQKMADSTWEQRTRTLNQSGYARYDESTSRMLGDTCSLLLDRYDGDLRHLRDAAERKPEREHELLTDFKGIGPMGADIFLREVQVAWDEVYPFVDDRTLKTAKDLGLGNDVGSLARLVERADFARLVAALVRTAHAGDQDDLL